MSQAAYPSRASTVFDSEDYLWCVWDATESRRKPLMQQKTRPSTARAGGKRRRRPRDELMSQIVLAAAEEFKRVGYAEARTAAIAQNAGVTETQLFRYFGSKSNLFRDTIFHPLADHLSKFIEDYLPQAMSYPYTTDLQKFISANIDMFKSLVVVEAYGDGDTQGMSQVNSLNTYFERGETALRSWSAETPKVDPKLMVRVSFVAVLANIMFKDWVFPPGLASDEEVTAAINDFVMDGVNAVKQPRGA